MFKRISFYLLLTSCAFGQNFGFPNNLQVTTVGGGTNSGSSSGGTNITIVGSTNVVFTTNQAFGTTYTNLYSVPITVFGGEVILSNTGTGASGITFSAISGGVIGVGTTAAGIWSVAIPTFSVAAGGTWSYTDVSTGTSKSFLLPASFQVALTSPVNGAITVASLPVTIGNGGSGQTTARAASSALGVQLISAIGGGSTLDYTTATPGFQGQFGITYAGNLEPNIFYGSATGVGTNGWGRTPLTWINSFDYVGGLGLGPGGNWADFPSEAIGNNTTILQLWGPAAAGITNNPQQPQFKVINGNPRSGTAQVSVAAAMTNSTWGGVLQGQDSLGRNIYVDQFGFALYNNGDDVKPLGALQETQQPATWGLLGNEPKEIMFITQNASRPSDTSGGQVGGMYIDWTACAASGDVVWGIPVQQPNIWMPTNTSWQNLMIAHEGPGIRAILFTNATVVFSNIESGQVPATINGGYYFNAGHVWLFRKSGGDDQNAMFTVNTNGSFNSDDSAWSFDAGGSERLGFVKHNAQFPGLYAGSGSPLNLGHSSASALQTGVSASTLTNELFIDSHGTVQVLRGIATQGTATGTITATGWTNSTGTNCQVDYDASSSTITNWNSGGIPWRTNTTITGSNFHTDIQAGGKITASGGLTGAWTVW